MPTAKRFITLLFFMFLVTVSLAACGGDDTSDSDIPEYINDGDTVDGDVADGDIADGDTVDGDITDGDEPTDGDEEPGDGDVSDGDVTDGDVTDGDVTDGDVTDGDVTDGDVTDGDVTDGDVTDGDMTDGDITDGDVTDGDVTDGDIEPGEFCRAWDDCDGLDVCDFALGRCERRDLVPSDTLAIYNFKPPAAAAGDTIVIDGSRFYFSLLGLTSVAVSVDNGPAFPAGSDENRCLWTYNGDATGFIGLGSESGFTYSPEPLLSASPGLIACDGTTPAASGIFPTDPDITGPYAAAYYDLPGKLTRLYYPALCGSVRRPPVTGEFPLVGLLHGDGGQYLNYEYLAQFLASWGFVSFMPEETGTEALAALANSFRDTDLSAISSHLAGVSTTSEIVLVGHSRGTARLEQITDYSAELRQATLASIFLGPVDDGLVAPGMFMTFYATGDRQSNDNFNRSAYNRQASPKWYFNIQGGNHSLFTDHKVWLGALTDIAPEISRSEQFRIVTRFVLPLCQRAFGLEESFPELLDAPPEDPAYTVEYDL